LPASGGHRFGTNQIGCSASTLLKANALPVSQTATITSIMLLNPSGGSTLQCGTGEICCDRCFLRVTLLTNHPLQLKTSKGCRRVSSRVLCFYRRQPAVTDTLPVSLPRISGTAYSGCYCIQFSVLVSSAINHDEPAESTPLAREKIYDRRQSLPSTPALRVTAA